MKSEWGEAEIDVPRDRKSRTLIEGWSSRWDWVQRVRLWDNFVVAEEVKRAKRNQKSLCAFRRYK